MGYIRGRSDYSTIQSQAAMLKHLWEQDRKQKELLKRALISLDSMATADEAMARSLNGLIEDIKEAIKA